jgi:Ribosome biogenesis protein Nop16
VPLVKKYGEDYAAMARDIKMNKFQLSGGQLKKKILRVLSH